MKKISRRDYLTRMGAGAAGMAGAGLYLFPDKHDLAVSSPSELIEARAPKRNLTQDEAWPPVYDMPNDKAMVTLIFGGLMGFFYNRITGTCDIGFHPGDGMHKPQVQIHEKIDTDCREMFSLSPLSSEIKRMTLDVIQANGAVKPTMTKFFKKDSLKFDRYKGEPKDFRWLLDLDGEDFYPEKFTKKKKFNRALIVSQGIFYTRTITNSTFYRVDNKQGQKPVGHMPMLMAAEVPLGAKEYVRLQLQTYRGNLPVTLSEFNLYQKDKSIFEIQLLNGCGKNEGCEWDYGSDDEEDRNDFHYMRKVLSLPGGKTKYGLKIETKAATGAVEDRCPTLHFKNTDEAPCMGAGYGGGGGP